MKRKKLEIELWKYGWYFLRHSANHDAWTNGELKKYVPRHGNVDERTAKTILKLLNLIKFKWNL